MAIYVEITIGAHPRFLQRPKEFVTNIDRKAICLMTNLHTFAITRGENILRHRTNITTRLDKCVSSMILCMHNYLNIVQ